MKFTHALVALMLTLSTTGFAKDKGHVILEIDGIEIGEVALHQGPSIQTQIVDYQDGEDIILKSRPGLSRFGEIVLSRKMEGEKKLLDWYLKTLTGQVERKCGALIIRNKNGEMVDRYDFEGAWPAKWEGGLKEKITLAVDSIALSVPAEEEEPVAIFEETEDDIEVVMEEPEIEEPVAPTEEEPAPPELEEPVIEEPALEPEVEVSETEPKIEVSEPETEFEEPIFLDEEQVEEE